LPIAHKMEPTPRTARVKGGAAGERGERTLEAGEHGVILKPAMGRQMRCRQRDHYGASSMVFLCFRVDIPYCISFFTS